MQDAKGRKLAPSWLMPILLCWVSFGLRLEPLWANRFHSDEALYASWALAIAFGRDRLLALAAPDKPPLLFYLMAVAFFILGHAEVAARLIGVMAGVLSVALMWQLAQLCHFERSEQTFPCGKGTLHFAQDDIFRGLANGSGIAALAMALSPMAIAFSPTAFLDPLMVMFVLASLVAVTRRRPGWAGVFLGLAAATKLQALIFGPLAAAGAIVVNSHNSQATQTPDVLRSRRPGVLVLRLLLGLALPLVAVLVWDRLRGGEPFWIQQTINYGGIRFVYASEVMPRLTAWLYFLPFFFGWPLLAALAIGLPVLLIYDLTRGARTWAAVFDMVLVAFALGYFFLHWLLAFPVWDRYIFGLVPVICLLIGRLASLLIGWVEKWLRSPHAAGLVAVALVFSMAIPSAAQAMQSQLPIGGDHGPHDGVDRVSDYLRGYPYGTVVYDHWLGWTLRYYLWDSRIYVAYFDAPQALAEDLHVFGRTSPRFIVFPANESTARIERAIVAEGFILSPVLSTQDRRGQPTFVVYRIDAYTP